MQSFDSLEKTSVIDIVVLLSFYFSKNIVLGTSLCEVLSCLSAATSLLRLLRWRNSRALQYLHVLCNWSICLLLHTLLYYPSPGQIWDAMLQNQILRTKLLNSMGLTARPNYLVSRYRKPHELLPMLASPLLLKLSFVLAATISSLEWWCRGYSIGKEEQAYRTYYSHAH